MKLIAGLISLLILASCSKSTHAPSYGQPTPQQALLISAPWVLKKSDTAHYDAGNNLIDHTTYSPSGCGDAHHYSFHMNYFFVEYTACALPHFDSTNNQGWTWGLTRDEKTINWHFEGGSPRSPSWQDAYDSIITLTKDSLVVSQRLSKGQFMFYPHGNVTASTPEVITDVYTH
ncbi:MAG: hypothetical protein JST68_07680 [Bacteroidetes bacterium]|nr:hypothetical protein [Bacteroidota bacterium]